MGFSGNGSSSTISGASDAAVSNVQNNDVLTYNTTVAKWQNKPAAVATDATTSGKGVVQLNGDLAGTASAPTVAKLNGISVTGTPTTGQVLTATGTVAAAWSTPGGLSATAVKTAAYTANPGDYIPVNASNGTVTVTLPAAPADGSRIAVKLVSTSGNNVCTIVRSGSDVFNLASGATSLTIGSAGLGTSLQYAASSGIWYSLDSTPLSSLNGAFAPSAGPVPPAYAAATDARFVSAIAGRKVADFTLALTDAGTIIEAESSSTITVTVPPASSVPFIDNTLVEISQTGAGQVVLSAGSGVTLQNAGGLKTRTQWSSVSLRKRPGSGASLPASGMLMRFRADDLSGSNGSAIASWPESSGNGLPAATQATSANQPTLTTNALNGHKGVTFNGTNSFLSLTGNSLNVTANQTAFSLFVVYTCPTVSSGSRTLIAFSTGTTTGNNRAQLQHRNASGNSLAAARRLDTDNGIYPTGGTVVAGENVVLSGVFNYAAASAALYKNGTSTATASFASSGATSNTPSLAASIGASPVGSTENFYGTIMEIIAYSAVDAGTLAGVDTYIQNTYGISTADFAGVGDQWVITGDTVS